MTIAARTANEVNGTGPVYDVAGRLIVTGPDGAPITGGGGVGGGDASQASQTAQIAQIGEVQASPTSNTVLDRLKTIATNVGLLATSAQVGEVQASPTANTLLDRLKTIATSVAAATPAGSNTIGKVDLNAGTNAIGNTNVAGIGTAANKCSAISITTSSAQVAAANSARKALFVSNNDAALFLYLALGTTAVTAQGIKVPPGGTCVIRGDEYTGRVDGVGTGSFSATVAEA